MGLGRRLLLLLLTACVPVSQGLRCMQCKDNQNCLVKECALGQDLCKTTVLREWEDNGELEVVMTDCANYERTNRTMSYRVNSKIISLAEVMCATDVCNRPRPGARGVAFPRGRYLECMSCSSLDQSCERGREQSLQCRYPGEQCVEVVTLGSMGRSLKNENYIKGCGSLPGCPGVAGFHSNRTFHFLKCCNSTHCNGGPVLDLQDLPPNGFQCYSCEGNSTHGCSSKEMSLIDCRGPMNQCLEATGLDVLANRSYTMRGCATASWCQGSHVADAFLLDHPNTSCCDGSGCNGPSSGAPRPDPAHLGFIVSLLLTVLLWT
ncbi:urokinase plasminogen activator surface receptor isoform X1 [Phodopus roborovskii]|uniref:Urokinase plasminogen activator surface receptor n=1 Tax=Phodopus roborovskii TaxID=109678 RepID=A0AAV0A9U6_PHORO|nr:urokinase plasminogen activator surface receptor isoform X1 [Phodopus roborovskii]CAH7385592.1 Plaur [Phodopus roborovskii]